MENASKALTMAGGILIALLVLGALLLMFNQVSDYKKTETVSEEAAQLAQFNEQFTQYERNNLAGVDLISLINKVVDYNKKNTGVGEIDYSKKIELYVNMKPAGKKSFAEKYAIENVCFKENNYTFNETTTVSSSKFFSAISDMRSLEETYGRDTMSKLVSYISNLESASNKQEEINRIVGKTTTITLDEIKKYSEYTSLKTATFKSTGDELHNNGQIKKISFEFVK